MWFPIIIVNSYRYNILILFYPWGGCIMVREAMDFVTAFDPELGRMIEAEYKRQARNNELIASENIVSEAVMAAMGSVLTNKLRRRLSRQALLRRLQMRR